MAYEAHRANYWNGSYRMDQSLRGAHSNSQISTAQQRPFVELVDHILKAKDASPAADTTELEEQIDRLVYDLYGLMDEEITAVERSLGLIHATDEEEAAALYRAIADGKRQLT